MYRDEVNLENSILLATVEFEPNVLGISRQFLVVAETVGAADGEYVTLSEDERGVFPTNFNELARHGIYNTLNISAWHECADGGGHTHEANWPDHPKRTSVSISDAIRDEVKTAFPKLAIS